MRRGRMVALGAGLLVLLVARLHQASGDASAIVATVGSSQITAADVQGRLEALPAYQRRALGASSAEVRDQLVREVLVVDRLLAEEARRRRLEQDPAVLARINEARCRALEEQERQRLQREDPVTDEDVRHYYDANRARFDTPQRIRLWRILVDTEEVARRIIAEAQGATGPQRWTANARQHSRDTATRMRKGDLGFVREDGRTDVPRVRVDPALFAAAAQVQDGAVVAQPVREGDRFAVVWRRGSRPASSRSLEQEAAAIRAILLRAKVREAVDTLVRELRQRHVTAVDESLLHHVSVTTTQFPPGQRVSGTASAPVNSAKPQPTDRGLR